jgi:hypothetical protein
VEIVIYVAMSLVTRLRRLQMAKAETDRREADDSSRNGIIATPSK